MKILLLAPPKGRTELPIFPLGLAQIAAGLRLHSVKIYDLNLFPRPLQVISRIMNSENPDIVGVSLIGVDSSASYDKYFYYDHFTRLIRKIREVNHKVTIVVGGPGFTLFAKEIMADLLEIDFGVPFEGEETFAELIENLNFPHVVKGLYYREGNKVVYTGMRAFLDLEHLPSPRRDLTRLDAYSIREEQIGVQTKRGCPFSCLYCTYPYLGGNRVRMRDAEKVVDEIENLAEQGIRKIFICDSVFNYPPEHAAEICQGIIRRKIKISWKAFFNEKFISLESVKLATRAGCKVFIFGPDGSHPKTLESIRKNFSFTDMKNAYDLLKNVEGAQAKYTFMFNAPGETMMTFYSTLKWAVKFVQKYRFDFSVSNIRIYPHTPLYHLAVKRGIIERDTSLIVPRYYDPFPLRLVSYPLNAAGNIIYRLKQCLQSQACKRTPAGF